MIKQENGFTLVELVVTIILVGLVGTFTSLFIYTGLNGYLTAKDTSDGALKAQIALDRISLELRDIDKITAYNENVEIEYTSTTLPGNRKITFNTNAIIIDVDDIANEFMITGQVGFNLLMGRRNSAKGKWANLHLVAHANRGEPGRRYPEAIGREIYVRSWHDEG